MTQIKLFMEKTPKLEVFESKVNAFLKENEGRRIVKDIKYTAESPNPNNAVWIVLTAMIIYEVK